MSKRIIAIGGGECGRITKSGIRMPYETKKIDEEIIKLTNKTGHTYIKDARTVRKRTYNEQRKQEY